MIQDTNDNIIRVITEMEQYEVRLNWDADGDSMIRCFANIMRSMTYPTKAIINSLRSIADELEMDSDFKKGDNILIPDEEYGTTD